MLVRDFAAVTLPAIIGSALTLWALHDGRSLTGTGSGGHPAASPAAVRNG